MSYFSYSKQKQAVEVHHIKYCLRKRSRHINLLCALDLCCSLKSIKNTPVLHFMTCFHYHKHKHTLFWLNVCVVCSTHYGLSPPTTARATTSLPTLVCFSNNQKKHRMYCKTYPLKPLQAISLKPFFPKVIWDKNCAKSIGKIEMNESEQEIIWDL